MTEKEKKIVLESPADYMRGFADLLSALAVAEEEGSIGMDKGLLLLSDVAYHLEGQFKKGLTGFDEGGDNQE